MKTQKFIKLISVIMSVMLLLNMPLSALANQSISVYMNNEKINFDTEPMLINDRTMVPMRAIFEKLGAVVEWDDKNNTALVQKEHKSISVTIGAPYMTNGHMRAIPLDSPAVLHNGRTLVPLRAVSQVFGCEVQWDEDTNTVNIYTENYLNYLGADSSVKETEKSYDDISANKNQIRNLINKGLYLEAITECKNAREWHHLSPDDENTINILENEAQQKYNEYVEKQKIANKNKKVTDNQKKEIYSIIKERVSLMLKSPSNAIWPDYTKPDYSYNEDGKICVFGNLEGMNGFGGYVIVKYVFTFNEDFSIDFEYVY